MQGSWKPYSGEVSLPRPEIWGSKCKSRRFVPQIVKWGESYVQFSGLYGNMLDGRNDAAAVKTKNQAASEASEEKEPLMADDGKDSATGDEAECRSMTDAMQPCTNDRWAESSKSAPPALFPVLWNFLEATDGYCNGRQNISISRLSCC